MAGKVVLHIGTPKTGTSMIQDVLARNHTTLREQGVLIPDSAFDHQYRAGLDLLDARGDDHRGAWDRLAAQVRSHDGTVVISNEILTRATEEQIARAASSLGDARLEVVISVRDLARQIASGWQEAIKHRATLPYGRFLAALRKPNARRRVARGFWAVQDWPAAARRWAVVADSVRIVTVPASGSDPDLLRLRLLQAMGIDTEWTPNPASRLNTRLGAAEVKVLRDLNARHKPASMDAGRYAEFVRERLVGQLAARSEHPIPIALPPSEYDWVAALTQRWLAEITDHEYEIIGDLADLEPRPQEWTDPDRVALVDELAAARTAIDILLEGQIAERERNVDRFYEIGRAYARRRAGRLRTVRALVRVLRLRRSR